MLTFEELKAIGDMCEFECQKRIMLKNGVSIIEIQTADNYKTVHYDFKTSDGFTYEVKADNMSQATGNFFIELMGYNKPSGLSITTADMHILVSGNEYYLMNTTELKRLINKNTFKVVSTHNKSTYGHLIPKHYIKMISEILI